MAICLARTRDASNSHLANSEARLETDLLDASQRRAARFAATSARAVASVERRRAKDPTSDVASQRNQGSGLLEALVTKTLQGIEISSGVQLFHQREGVDESLGRTLAGSGQGRVGCIANQHHVVAKPLWMGVHVTRPDQIAAPHGRLLEEAKNRQIPAGERGREAVQHALRFSGFLPGRADAGGPVAARAVDGTQPKRTLSPQ